MISGDRRNVIAFSPSSNRQERYRWGVVNVNVRLGPILVLGATGRQGGAVARQLLHRGVAVRAFVRDLTRPETPQLRHLGAEIAVGDLNTPASLDSAMRGVRGVYSVQSWEDGVATEMRQGALVAETAQRHDLDLVVYSSVAAADRDTGVPHFESKFVIEQRILDLGLEATILRPVYFMENFLQPAALDAVTGGKLRLPLPPEVPLQLVAVTDIGAFAADAFEHPARWRGRTLTLAGDELTMPQVAEHFADKLGRRVSYEQVPLEDFRRTQPERALMFEWLTRHNFGADLRQLRLLHPQLLTFAQWLSSVAVPPSAGV